MSNNLPEKKLVEEIIQGNERVLKQFYHHYYPSLLNYILRKVADKNDAEEILQDTLLATIDALRDFSFKSSLFTFICSVANHKVIDFYRKKKIKKIVFSKFVEIEPLLSTIFGPEEVLNEELLKQKIKTTFARISPRYTLILKLKYTYGFSVDEIARKLSISYKSVESQLFRARRAFAHQFSL